MLTMIRHQSGLGWSTQMRANVQVGGRECFVLQIFLGKQEIHLYFKYLQMVILKSLIYLILKSKVLLGKDTLTRNDITPNYYFFFLHIKVTLGKYEQQRQKYFIQILCLFLCYGITSKSFGCCFKTSIF